MIQIKTNIDKQEFEMVVKGNHIEILAELSLIENKLHLVRQNVIVKSTKLEFQTGTKQKGDVNERK